MAHAVKFSLSFERSTNEEILYNCSIVSIILVAILLITCPKESDFKLYLEDKYALKCDEGSFECTQNVDGKKEKLKFEKYRCTKWCILYDCKANI